MHAENFGAFTNDEGRVVYSVNDFDEAIYADYQFDVWRMAISLGLVTDGVFSRPDQARIIARFARAYLDMLAKYAENPKLDKSEFGRRPRGGN
ncbi:MAG: DUF2252 family protein [Anaerolineae bacterium]|nr:DUF2252 family protein [Anaerolineae bacterium]